MTMNAATQPIYLAACDEELQPAEQTEPTVGRAAPNWRDERGEGVISAAIAVLIVAFLGVAMWAGFNTIWENIETQTNDQITQIGANPGDS